MFCLICPLCVLRSKYILPYHHFLFCRLPWTWRFQWSMRENTGVPQFCTLRGQYFRLTPSSFRLTCQLFDVFSGAYASCGLRAWANHKTKNPWCHCVPWVWRLMVVQFFRNRKPYLFQNKRTRATHFLWSICRFFSRVRLRTDPTPSFPICIRITPIFTGAVNHHLGRQVGWLGRKVGGR